MKKNKAKFKAPIVDQNYSEIGLNVSLINADKELKADIITFQQLLPDCDIFDQDELKNIILEKPKYIKNKNNLSKEKWDEYESKIQINKQIHQESLKLNPYRHFSFSDNNFSAKLSKYEDDRTKFIDNAELELDTDSEIQKTKEIVIKKVNL
ncbi:hypothetical protein [Mycoplasmopsis opalescens]|uniref:hypothetical protein n=1 Tax=Mycoplasmopsis opalescens TaxID=114886 RepID=UPI0004A6D2D8|nr:hypothetical protein [Mycoplasmopsis opalescens]